MSLFDSLGESFSEIITKLLQSGLSMTFLLKFVNVGFKMSDFHIDFVFEKLHVR